MYAAQTIPARKNNPPNNLNNVLISASNLKYYLRCGNNKHPEGKDCKGTMEQISGYRIFTPGLVFFTEYSRKNHDDSDKLKNSVIMKV